MRHIRRIVQLVSLALFIVLIVTVTKPLTNAVPPEIFLRLDPLIAITAILAARTFIALTALAAVTLVVSVLLGRVFCGWVCPMGTTLDIFKRVFLRKRKYAPARTEWLPKLKYVLLTVLIILAIMGVQGAGWFDPISLSTRTYGMVLYPVADRLLNVGTEPIDALHDRLVEMPYVLDPIPGVYSLMIWNGLIFAVILGLEVAQRRFWCRNLCPLGALLGLAGRWNLLPVRSRKPGSSCGNCARVCPTGAIHQCRVSPTECIQCFSCTAKSVCPRGSLTHRPGLPLRVGKGEAFAAVPGRRAFVLSALGGIVAAPLLWAGFSRKKREAPPVRPPGGQEERDFLARCVRCGECMKVCPNNAIQPCVMEAGTEGFMTPRLVPRVGYCEFDCAGKTRGAPAGAVNNLCGQVCPTGALQRLDKRAKQSQKLGTAYVDRSKCIPWVHGLECTDCFEACPAGAIQMLRTADRPDTVPEMPEDDILQRPFVIVEACIGCGKCEYVCPVAGRAAIRVDRWQG